MESAVGSARPDNSTNVRAPAAPWYLRAGFAAVGTVSTPLASAWAERLFLTAPRPKPPAREVAALKDASRGTMVANGVPIATWTWGRGPAVLLVHGWGGRGGQLAPFAADLVASGYSVVAYDGPGHGVSGGDLTSIVDLGRAIPDIVDACASPVVAVIAHSVGCAATTFALTNGLSIERAVFVAPPTRVADWATEFAAALRLRPEVMADVRRRVEARLGVGWDDLDMAVMAPKMSLPLLVIHDRHDKEVSYASGEAVAAAWPGARLVTTESLGHKRILDDADVVAAAVGFVRGR